MNDIVTRVRVDLSQWRSGMAEFRSSVAGVTSAVGSFRGALVAAATSGLVLMAKQALDTAGSLGEMSRRVGVGVETLQELQFAASQADVDVAGLETGLRMLNRSLGEAAAGNKTKVEAFRSLGVAFEIGGKVRDASDALDDIADALARGGSQATMIAQSMEVFSRSGAAMIPMLEGGRAGLQKYREEARRLGLVLDESLVGAADRASDAVAAATRTLSVSFARVIISAAPEIEAFSRIIADLAANWSSFITRWFVPSSIAPSQEIANRLVEARDRLRELRQEMDRPGSFPGVTKGMRADFDVKIQTAEQRIRDLEAQLRSRLAEETAELKKPPGGPSPPGPEQIEALKQLRDRAALAAILDAETQALVKLKQELRDLAEKVAPGATEEARRLADEIYRGAAAATAQQGRISELTRALGDEGTEWEGLKQAQDDVGAARAQNYSWQKLQNEATEEFLRTLGPSELSEWEGLGAAVDANATARAAAVPVIEDLARQLQLERAEMLAGKDAALEARVAYELFKRTLGELTVAERDQVDQLAAIRRELLTLDIDKSIRRERRELDVLRVELTAGKDAADAARAAFELFGKTLGELTPTEQAQVAQLSAVRREARELGLVADTIKDVFGAVEGALEKTVTGVIMGTNTMRDAFRSLAQSIVLEFTQRVIRNALRPLMDALAQVAVRIITTGSLGFGLGGSATGSALPFAAAQAAQLGISGATGPGLGAVGFGTPGIGATPGFGSTLGWAGAIATPLSIMGRGMPYSALTMGAWNAFNLYQAYLGPTLGNTPSAISSAYGLAGSPFLAPGMGNLASLSGAASIAGLAGAGLSLAGFATGNQQLSAAGSLAGIGSIGLALAATPTGFTQIAAAAILAIASIMQAFETSANWENLPPSVRTGTKFGVMTSPIGLALSPFTLSGLIPENMLPFVDPIGAMIGGLFGSLFGGNQVPKAVREAREANRAIGAANAFQSSIVGSTSLGQLYNTLVKNTSGYLGGTSGLAIMTGITGQGFFGSPRPGWNPAVPTISLEEFKAFVRSGAINDVFASTQAGVSPEMLTGANAAVAKTLKEMALALLEVEDAFTASLAEFKKKVTPFVVGDEIELFDEFFADLEAEFNTAGAAGAQAFLDAFMEEEAELIRRIEQQYRALTQTLSSALQAGFQSADVATSVDDFTRELKAQIASAVTSALVEAVTQSEAFQAIVTPAVTPLRAMIERIMKAPATALTPEFFATLNADLQALLTGVTQRLEPFLPILSSLFGFNTTLNSFLGLGAGPLQAPAIANVPVLPGFARGGAFVVDGAGGPDSKVVAFRASPGERVVISAPGDRSGDVITITMNVTISSETKDPRAMARELAVALQDELARHRDRSYVTGGRHRG